VAQLGRFPTDSSEFFLDRVTLKAHHCHARFQDESAPMARLGGVLIGEKMAITHFDSTGLESEP